MPRRYPLEPLVPVRRERADRRAAELAKATTTRAREQAAARRARERHDQAERAAVRAEQAERTRLHSGEQRALDLAQGARHGMGVKARLGELAREQDALAERERRARENERKAQSALGRARAEHEAAVRHKERFDAQEAHASEQAAEDAVEDHFLSTHRGAGRG
jgi:hypothetical protein